MRDWRSFLPCNVFFLTIKIIMKGVHVVWGGGGNTFSRRSIDSCSMNWTVTSCLFCCWVSSLPGVHVLYEGRQRNCRNGSLRVRAIRGSWRRRIRRGRRVEGGLNTFSSFTVSFSASQCQSWSGVEIESCRGRLVCGSKRMRKRRGKRRENGNLSRERSWSCRYFTRVSILLSETTGSREGRRRCRGRICWRGITGRSIAGNEGGIGLFYFTNQGRQEMFSGIVVFLLPALTVLSCGYCSLAMFPPSNRSGMKFFFLDWHQDLGEKMNVIDSVCHKNLVMHLLVHWKYFFRSLVFLLQWCYWSGRGGKWDKCPRDSSLVRKNHYRLLFLLPSWSLVHSHPDSKR